jgi:hypothetical protein
LAWGKNKTVETISADELLELQERAETLSPEKLVIVAGPTFGTVLKFLLLGAALGAAGVVLLRDRNTSDEDTADFPAGSDGSASTLANRANAVLGRAKGLASRARYAAQAVAVAARPSLKEAISQAKATAEQTQRELESDISKEEG